MRQVGGQLTGQTLGQYRLDQHIGVGGMADVYRALQLTLDRQVALKIIDAHADRGVDADFIERFREEARMVASLAHPYIVTIHDFDVTNGWAYIVMEYIAGGSIRDHLAIAAQKGQRLQLAWALAVLEQSAHALDYAHERGVVHRDVKPANMLLRAPNLLVLSDFGVAKMLLERTIQRGAPIQPDRTRVVGTPQYMSPEQCRGSSQLDGRSDIYSLGVTLYQCATALLPFNGENDEVMYQQIHAPPPRPTAVAPLIPPEVEWIILKAMAKNPDQRFQRASEMAQAMHSARMRLERPDVPPSRQPAPNTMPMHAPQVSAPMPPHSAQPWPSGNLGACFRCGQPNQAGNLFCVHCGYEIGAHQEAVDRYLKSGRPLRCRVNFLSGPLRGHAYRLHQGVTTFGRSQGNDVMLRDDGTISRQHARLTFMGGQWVIEDLNSHNGVYVNRTRMRRPLALAHGDRVRMGDVEMLFELAQ